MKRSEGFKENQQLAKAAGWLLLVIILVIAFRQKDVLVEHVYTQHIYRWLCYLVRPFVNLFPFSLGDIFYLSVVMIIIAGIIRAVRYLVMRQFRQFRKHVIKAVIGLEVIWLVFYLFWGLNYYRPPAAKLLNLADTTYTIKDIASVTGLIIDSANILRQQLTKAELQPDGERLYGTAQTAVIASQRFAPQFDVISPKVKPAMLSAVINYMATSGYYNPFSFEAQMNDLMQVIDKPFVACHEMSHQAGWAREDEANFAGYLAGVQSKDRLLRYSSYYAGISEFMRYLHRRDTVAHKALVKRISPLVIQDFKADSAYWTKYQGGAEMVSGVFYDKFLKANNQPHGLHTYNRMIMLTMSWYRRRYHAW